MCEVGGEQNDRVRFSRKTRPLSFVYVYVVSEFLKHQTAGANTLMDNLSNYKKCGLFRNHEAKKIFTFKICSQVKVFLERNIACLSVKMKMNILEIINSKKINQHFEFRGVQGKIITAFSFQWKSLYSHSRIKQLSSRYHLTFLWLISFEELAYHHIDCRFSDTDINSYWKC